MNACYNLLLHIFTMHHYIIMYHLLLYVIIADGTIGRTSRATFGIPAIRLNITIYPILGESLL